MTISEARVQPFYCPYCGEEDFVPSDLSAQPEAGGGLPGRADARDAAGSAYHCRSCDRRFAVRFLGLGPG